MADLAPGSRLGPYEILGPLGSGGMGQVYRARDTRLQREVAIKVLSSSLLADESARARFHKEALALAKLKHRNVAHIYDVIAAEGADALVMELVEGASLSDRLREGPLPEREVLRLGAQLADGLSAAHAEGVVHCDLKPANLIFIDETGAATNMARRHGRCRGHPAKALRFEDPFSRRRQHH